MKVIAALLVPFFVGCSMPGMSEDFGSPTAAIIKDVRLSEVVGSHSGTWSAENDDTGTVALKIEAQGTVTGEEREDGDKPVAKLTGTVSQDGKMDLICHYEGYRPDRVSGKFGKNTRGQLIAEVTFHHEHKTVEQVYFLKPSTSGGLLSRTSTK